MPIERKLAAIMFTDIAGYTESMSKSESKSLDTLEKKRSILQPLIKEYKGTFVKEIGDGTLSNFESAVNAATCAVKLQETTYDDKEMNIRVGIHIGDIVFKDGDVFGGGVNVASRLESIAPAGGVCVSKSVYDELSNQDDFDGIELGLQSLKGVGRLIEVFGLKGEKLNEPDPQKYQDNKVVVHSDDEVPSIAIIPFDNKGADEDAFYAYGISADLISDCSGAGLIRVASKTDIEKLDYQNLDNTELSQKLLVRYIANGELWRMGDMFQLSVELYDTKDKKVVWSDRWQEKWDNLPTIKGSLSNGLLKALDTKPKVEQKVETTNTEAYEFYLKAKHKYEKRENTDDTEIARGMLNKAIKLDGNLISAKLLLGWTYSEMGDYDKAREISIASLKLSEDLEDKALISKCLYHLGTFYTQKDNLISLEYYFRSLNLSKEIDDKVGIAKSLTGIGIMYQWMNEFDKSLYYCKKSIKIFEELENKYGATKGIANLGILYYYKGDYDKALESQKYTLEVYKELGYHSEIIKSLYNIGNVYVSKGKVEKAISCLNQSLDIAVKLGDKFAMAYILASLGSAHDSKKDYERVVECYEKSHLIQNEIGDNQLKLETTIYIYLSNKNLAREYDVNLIHKLIKDTEHIEHRLNFRLYELLEDKSYLKIAYNQVQELADNLEPDVAAKFLSYPIPKAIVEEWEKVK